MRMITAGCILLLIAPPIATAEAEPTAEHTRERIERGLRVVERGAANYPSKRDCFSCHHQTLPMLAMVEARRIGIEPQAGLLEEQAGHTRDFFAGRVDAVRKGEGVGGRGMTAAYALWALHLAGEEPGEVSDALVAYLVKRQNEDGHWKPPSHRPPLEESSIANTFLAAYYMEGFSAPDNEAAKAAIEKAKRWLAASEAKSQEDFNTKLWALSSFGGEQPEIDEHRERILAAQREDGGWSQLPDMESDAYATGQTLFVLREGGLALSHEAMQRGVDYLLRTQQPDGSWFVETRSRPVQKFFDNGDPHGENQFISIAATSWATAALAALHAHDAPPSGPLDEP